MKTLVISILISVLALGAAGCAASSNLQTEAPGKAGGAPVLGAPNASGPAAALALRETGAAPIAGDAASTQSLDRMIIRSTTLNLSVRDVANALDAINVAVNRLGGYVANTRFKNDSDQASVSISVRVPRDRADAFLLDARHLATKVNEETTSSQDVTDEYTDLGSQLRNQEAAELQYLELLRRAQTVDDILKVQQQLTNIRGQIERTKGRMQLIDRRTDFVQIDLTLVPEITARGAWDPNEIVRRAWQASLSMLQRVAEVAITVVVFMWWVVPLGAVAFGVALGLRQRRGLVQRPSEN
ncbi:MAG: DUF4349 domain-containing protein [Chloroflexi bacterium]|nr:DUF4349 domain-containing protein [Chloroflexota bacterium]